MASRHLSGRRSDVPAVDLFLHRLHGGRASVHRHVGFCHAAAPRSYRARPVTTGLADLHDHCHWPEPSQSISRRRYGQLCCRLSGSRNVPVPPAGRRYCADFLACSSWPTPAYSLTLGALFALANAVMFGSVTVAVRGMTKTEPTSTLLMWQMATLATPRVRLSMAHSRRCGHADGERGCQCRRPVSLDEVASLGTSRGGIAILLSDAGMGACNRVSCVGRRADGWTCRRLSCCGRIRAILAVA